MEQPRNKEKILSAGTLIFIACWAAYCASYLGRINYTAALTAIVADGVFSKSHAGLIGTVYFFCYGAGQIFSGILGDRVSPYKMVGTGLVGTVCANILMPLCAKSYIVMSVVWGLNGIVQSMLWTPILYIISTSCPKNSAGARASISRRRSRSAACCLMSYPPRDKICVVAFRFFYTRRNNSLHICLLVLSGRKDFENTRKRGEKDPPRSGKYRGESLPRQAVHSLRCGGYLRRHTRPGHAQGRRYIVGADSY